MKRLKKQSILRFWFTVDGKSTLVTASTRDIAYEQLKKRYPKGEIKDLVVKRNEE